MEPAPNPQPHRGSEFNRQKRVSFHPAPTQTGYVPVIARRTSTDPDTRLVQLTLYAAEERPLRIRDAAEAGSAPTSRRLRFASRPISKAATDPCDARPPVRRSPIPEERRAGFARLALSPDEAARSLGVSRSFFFAEILPSLKVVRVGRRRLVSVRELDRRLEASGDRIISR